MNRASPRSLIRTVVNDPNLPVATSRPISSKAATTLRTPAPVEDELPKENSGKKSSSIPRAQRGQQGNDPRYLIAAVAKKVSPSVPLVPENKRAKKQVVQNGKRWIFISL